MCIYICNYVYNYIHIYILNNEFIGGGNFNCEFYAFYGSGALTDRVLEGWYVGVSTQCSFLGKLFAKIVSDHLFQTPGQEWHTPRSNLQPQVSPSPMLSADETSGACGRLGRSIAKWPGFCEVSFNTKTSSKYVHLGFVDVFHGLCMFMIVYVSCHYRVNECGRSFPPGKSGVFLKTQHNTALLWGWDLAEDALLSGGAAVVDHGWPLYGGFTGQWEVSRSDKIWDLRGTNIQTCYEITQQLCKFPAISQRPG